MMSCSFIVFNVQGIQDATNREDHSQMECGGVDIVCPTLEVKWFVYPWAGSSYIHKYESLVALLDYVMGRICPNAH